ncbi:DUF6232 family protein [Micromonosporaceae bacterium Da 78-11]
MRIYYRGPDAVVTSDLFVRRTPSTETYVISDLREVCIARHAGHGRAKALFAITVGLLILTIATTTGLWFVSLLCGCAALTTLVYALVRQQQPAHWELQALYHGEFVQLYSSSEDRVFNQVARALRRSIEAQRTVRHWDQDDAA